MTGFSADWLALREPFDRAARAQSAAALDWPALAARLQAACPPGMPLTVLDLGCGTGANLREIAPRLGAHQHWRLLDHDADLLAQVPAVLGAWATAQGWRAQDEGGLLVLQGPGLRIEVERRQADLATELQALPFKGTQLVTASALLDLVSAPWLATLVAQCRAAHAAVCWALNVDDRMAWRPVDADDGLVLAQFHAHQQRDKGFGPALGDAAVACASGLLQQAGYAVTQAASDWQIQGRDAAMVQAMIEGIGRAAVEQAPTRAAQVQAWQARRAAPGGCEFLQIGHVDLMAWPSTLDAITSASRVDLPG